MTDTSNNPLLDFSDLPPFDKILPAHVAPAIGTLIAEAEKALETVIAPDFPASWQEISAELDVRTERLSRAWGAVAHLKSVLDSPALRSAFNETLPLVVEFYTALGASAPLYQKYRAIDPAGLNVEQKQALKNALRAFVLDGAELQGQDKAAFTSNQHRLADLTQKFSENALDATDGFAYYAEASELDGVPEDILATARKAASADGKEGYKLTLHLPSYLPVMQFARNGVLRETLYRAYVTRASDQAAGDARQYDNTAIMQEILLLRKKQAELLDHENFGELSLARKMADSPEQVLAFLQDLAQQARPSAERDVRDLRDFAAQALNMGEPQAWDWTYISEQLKQARFAFSDQDIKPYFTLPNVLDGLFKLVQNLFEVDIKADRAAVWDQDVRFFRIERAGRLLGQFYLDPSARPGKRGGAWMDDARSRWLRADTHRLQTPVAYLVCNFAHAVDDKPVLLTHDNVITLFHEFGHGLHHMLTQIDELDVSGISGVEWDAVELPSQFMENFCWEWDVLQNISAHVDTGEPLPRALFEKMLAAKNYHAGMQTMRQIEYALLDMLLHTQLAQPVNIQALATRVRKQVAVLPTPAFNRMANTFSHIFAGGYAAGYYSYKWAEVLSADAYAAFEETRDASGTFSLETSRRFRQEILEKGGSRPAMQSFLAFRGREPDPKALLRHQGILG